MKAIDKMNFLKSVGSHSVRMRSNGDVTVLPVGAKDLPEPSLRAMFKENRAVRKKLLKLEKIGVDVGEELDFVRRRARWIQHEILRQARLDNLETANE